MIDHHIEEARPAGPYHQVLQVIGKGGYQRRPCAECPWRLDAPVGAFPAEAYRISAHTAYDGAMETFGCHMSGADNLSTCAGFLLANSLNNIGRRLAERVGRLDMTQVSSPVPLYPSYRAMAEANGVPSDDPALKPCRADHE
jgi:hypothetical protein